MQRVNVILIMFALKMISLQIRKFLNTKILKKSNISLKGNLKKNIAYWQNTLMANEYVLGIIENG